MNKHVKTRDPTFPCTRMQGEQTHTEVRPTKESKLTQKGLLHSSSISSLHLLPPLLGPHPPPPPPPPPPAALGFAGRDAPQSGPEALLREIV